MVIIDLWGMAYHAAVVIAPIYILLLDSIWACCVTQRTESLSENFSLKFPDFFPFYPRYQRIVL